MMIRIGISLNYREMPNGVEQAYLDQGYFDFLPCDEVIPVPLVPTLKESLQNRLLDDLAGIILTGGNDLDPKLWDEPRHEKTQLLHPRRQAADLAWYHQARKHDLPILGICMGMQLINVAQGGGLHQHLNEFEGPVDHSQGRHELIISRDSRLYRIFQRERTSVNTSHHQGVARLGRNLQIAAEAEDGVIEAIEHDKAAFCLGVQWHPERDSANPINQAVLKAFFNAARDYQNVGFSGSV
ncbi:MAG: gamma-glutamyl-gamma-aminobutyrate hydrolase family protein [Sedimentisphaerales bacterium]|nr:gamma-glutamyl-gamma-aminobutyrate hydrolase family protein [Sedimentisphaerales bacterium]